MEIELSGGSGDELPNMLCGGRRIPDVNDRPDTLQDLDKRFRRPDEILTVENSDSAFLMRQVVKQE